DFDRPYTHFVITAHNGDTVAALQFGDGSLRNEKRAPFCAGHSPDPAIQTGPKRVPRVWEDAGQLDRACFLIDLTVCDEESPFLRISRSISQHQLQFEFLAGPVPGARLRVASAVVEIFLLAESEIDLDRIDCRNRSQSAAGRVDQVAD